MFLNYFVKYLLKNVSLMLIFFFKSDVLKMSFYLQISIKKYESVG